MKKYITFTISLSLLFAESANAADYSAGGGTAASFDQTAIAIGTGANANNAAAVNMTAVGTNSTANVNAATAYGYGAQATGNQATAIGEQSLSNSANSTAIGGSSKAQAASATAIGNNAIASGTASTALGTAASATAANSVAVGADSSATLANSVAIGTNSTVTAVHTGPYTVTGGSIAGTGATSAVSFGTDGAPRQLQNVAAGVVSATSTDAVNGSQLYAVASQVSQHTNAITNINQNIVNLYQNQESLSRKAYEGTAVALASAGGNFLQQNQKFAVTGKFGTFRGQNALGVVAQARVNDNLIAHAGVGGGLRMGGIGASGGLTVGW